MNQTTTPNIKTVQKALKPQQCFLKTKRKAKTLSKLAIWKSFHFSITEFNELKERVPTWQISENLGFSLLEHLLHETSKIA